MTVFHRLDSTRTGVWSGSSIIDDSDEELPWPQPVLTNTSGVAYLNVVIPFCINTVWVFIIQNVGSIEDSEEEATQLPLPILPGARHPEVASTFSCVHNK